MALRVHHLADYSSTLLFESVRPDHRGNYTCLANNTVGTDAHTAAMVIYGECRPLPEWAVRCVCGFVRERAFFTRFLREITSKRVTVCVLAFFTPHHRNLARALRRSGSAVTQ